MSLRHPVASKREKGQEQTSEETRANEMEEEKVLERVCVCVHACGQNICVSLRTSPYLRFSTKEPLNIGHFSELRTSPYLRVFIHVHTYVLMCLTHMCLYMYTHMYVYVYQYMYVYICICIYIHVYTHAYIYVYIYVYIDTCVYVIICIPRGQRIYTYRQQPFTHTFSLRERFPLPAALALAHRRLLIYT